MSMFAGKTIQMNTPKLSLTGSSQTAMEAIYLLSTNELICINSQISAPKIFLKSPTVLQAQNCKIEGKLIYLSDPDTCTLYKDDPLVAAHCVGKHVDL